MPMCLRMLVVLCSLAFAFGLGSPAEIVDPLLVAFWRFDHNKDNIVRWNELAVGLLSSAEIAQDPPPAENAFGASQCADPTLDALSFIECLVAKARKIANKTLEVNFASEFASYMSGCSTPTRAWQSGDCMGSCSDCFHQSLLSVGKPVRSVSTWKEGSEGPVNGTKILMSSDWHIEPWYLSTSKLFACGGPTSKTCQFPNVSLHSMFTCRDAAGHNTTCLLDGFKDPPIAMEESHIASIGADAAKVHFFVGDTQTHAFNGNFDQPTAITVLLDRVLDAEVAHFGAANVVWTMGNNDGPHDAIFREQDSSTLAWADAVLKRSIVTDDLGIIYSNGANQTTLFHQTGFYCKPLLAIGASAYAIVLNTNLGGSNALQTQALHETLQWISTKHSGAGIVYLLGHHPSVMKRGVNLVADTEKSMIKGVFAGHVHFAASTDDLLFTQVPAITQCALNVAYWTASVSEAAPEIRLQKSQLYQYRGENHMPADPAMWTCEDGFDSHADPSFSIAQSSTYMV